MCVGAGLVEIAADCEGRVSAAVLERHCEHRRRSGLAMRSRHRHRTPTCHDRRKRSGTRQHTQVAPARLDDLWVVLANGRRDDDSLRVAELGPVMPNVDGGAEGPQTGSTPESLASLPDTLIPREHDPAMPLIPAPPIPTKCTGRVHRPQAPDPGEPRSHEPPLTRDPAAALPDHLREQFVRVAPAERSGCGAHRRQALLVSDQGGHVLADQAPVRAESSTSTPGPCLHQRLGVQSLLAVAVRKRHIDAGRPTAASSAKVMAPARQTARSAAAWHARSGPSTAARRREPRPRQR